MREIYTKISSVEIKKNIRKSRFDGLLLRDSSSHWSSLCFLFVSEVEIWTLCSPSFVAMGGLQSFQWWQRVVNEIKLGGRGNEKGTIGFATVARSDQ